VGLYLSVPNKTKKRKIIEDEKKKGTPPGFNHLFKERKNI